MAESNSPNMMHMHFNRDLENKNAPFKVMTSCEFESHKLLDISQYSQEGNPNSKSKKEKSE